MDDCTVRLIDLPEAVGAILAVDEDGHNNVYVNARWGYNGQRRAYKHEMKHIVNDDMNNADDIRTVEARADGTPPALRSIPRLIRAADLPRPQRRPVKLTHRQAAVLLRAVNDLDKFTS